MELMPLCFYIFKALFAYGLSMLDLKWLIYWKLEIWK